MRIFLLFLFVLFPFFSEGQARYFIYLKDKAGSSGSVDNPAAYLSPRAIERRNAQGISITERDLPVSKTYLDEIQKQGFKIIGKSKWLNTVLVDGPASKFTSLKSLAFVSGIEGNMDIRGSNCAACNNTSPTSKKIIIIRSTTPLAPTISSDKPTVCDSELATLTASGCTGVVKWSNGRTGASIQVGEGTYSVTCTTNCDTIHKSNTLTIGTSPYNNPYAPLIKTNKTVICKATDVATLTAVGCTGTVSWSHGETGTTVQVGAGVYTAVCTTDCGTSHASNLVTISTLTTLEAPVIIADNLAVCGTDSVTLTVDNCAGMVFWSNGFTGNTIRVGAGTYSATCTVDCRIAPSSRIKSKFDSPIAPVDYGSSANQIKMLGADTMHAAGFTGEGILIAVMDAGFPNVNTADAFAHLRSGNKIKRTYNFVEGSTNVYRDNTHGTNVLSIITALLPGKLLGTAPLADVALYTTEDNSSETKQEEVYWTFAAEDADSLGVDVINTSLGYSEFDDSNQNYTYEDMDGQTTIMVKAANYATQVGIIVVNSAGNEGDKPWKYISTPADGDHVIAVGAVTSTRSKAGFSSLGPSADGRIKPDVSAMGEGAYYSNSGSVIDNRKSGTSFSAPLIAGFMAGLKQQFPTLTSLQLRDILIRSADRYHKPDNAYGYGIPSYTRAVQIAYQDYVLLGNEQEEKLNVVTYPNPISDGETLKIKVDGHTLSEENQTVNLIDNSGRMIYKDVNLKSLNLKPLSSGIYHLSFNLNEKRYSQKLVIKK